MTTLRFEKCTEFPTTPDPNSVYFLLNQGGFDIGISNKEGTEVVRQNIITDPATESLDFVALFEAELNGATVPVEYVDLIEVFNSSLV